MAHYASSANPHNPPTDKLPASQHRTAFAIKRMTAAQFARKPAHAIIAAPEHRVAFRVRNRVGAGIALPARLVEIEPRARRYRRAVDQLQRRRAMVDAAQAPRLRKSAIMQRSLYVTASP